MTALAAALRARIRRDGPLSVATYMRLCLTHPTLGYYRRGTRIGRAGDFITAPEVSQMFGELIGLWCAVLWRSMGRPPRVGLVELGPGRGTLLADALRAARGVPGFCDAIRLHLVEANRTLRAAQRARLARARPAWHDEFEAVPRGPLLVVANEFFDALPIRQFERVGDGWRERVVALDPASGALRFGTTGAVHPGVVGLAGAPAGAVVERAPAREALAAAVAGRVATDGGAALIVDYGHAAPGLGDTLQAVRRHRTHPVLGDPGEADLTAHVDFPALAWAARRRGARVFGPVAQGRFLQALGIEARAVRLQRRANADQAAAIDSGLRRLTAPGGMGTLFKALALAHPALPPPPGFAAS